MRINSFAASLGLSSGVSTENKFGHNPDIDTGTEPEDLWEGGGLYPFVSAAQVLQVSSASLNDDGDPVGTGAHTVIIYGLDSNWNEVSATVILNGTTIVETIVQFIRVYRAVVIASGAVGSNDGLITITYKTAGTTAAVITAGSGQTLMAVYTVPSGTTALLTTMYATINSTLNNATGSRATIKLLFRSGADSATPVWVIKHLESIAIDGTSRMAKNWNPNLRVLEKTDIVIRCSLVSDNDSSVSGGFDMYVIKNATIEGW